MLVLKYAHQTILLVPMCLSVAILCATKYTSAEFVETTCLNEI